MCSEHWRLTARLLFEKAMYKDVRDKPSDGAKEKEKNSPQA
jgi:hypothetical protein